MARIGDTPRARALGVELRDARNHAGLTTRELAAKLGHKGNSKVTRWETGHNPPTETEAATVLGVLGVSGERHDRLLQLAREVADPNWLTPGVDRQLGALIDYEHAATSITEVNALFIPGLLQTADYARAIFDAAGLPKGEAGQRVMMRIARRDILTGPTPTVFAAFIGEYALRYQPGACTVGVGQLRNLLYWAAQPHVTIQIIPAAPGWSPALDGPFVLLEFDGRVEPVVHLEHHRSAATITDPGDIRDYKAAADRIRREAMSPEASTGLIAEIASEMESESKDDPIPLAQVDP